MTKAATWADGHGRWHVVVADTPKAILKASNAITREIHERDGVLTIEQVRKYVEANIVTWDQEGTAPGFVHFAEYGEDD